MERKAKKHPRLLKSIKLAAFGLVTLMATATLTYFIAPGNYGSGVNPNRPGVNPDPETPLGHGDILFSNLASMSGMKISNLSATVVLPDNDLDDETSNKISLTGDLALSMPTLSELALSMDATLTYGGYNEAKDVKKDLDITYLGSDKDLYVSLTDGYGKDVMYQNKSYPSGIRYCISGTEYDDLVDTIVEMLSGSRFSAYLSGDDENKKNDNDGMSSLMSTMKDIKMSIVENEDYQYTFTLDLGKEDEGWKPITLQMSSDENCNLTGVWTDNPIEIPLDSNGDKVCSISLDAKNVTTSEPVSVEAPNDANYSHLINSTSLMRNVFKIVDKEAFQLNFHGDIVRKYNTSSQGENLYETLNLSADMMVDYPNNKLDFAPILSSEADGDKYSYGMNFALRPLQEDVTKSNLYFDYVANDVPVGKLNFTNLKSLDKFLGNFVDSLGKSSNGVDLDKITSVMNRLTSLASGAKEIVTGNAELKGEGVPDRSLGQDGDTYLDTSTNRVYTKAEGEWTKNKLTLLDEIKEGHYQRCLDILKGVYTADNVISVVLTLEPFGLGEEATITLTLNSSEQSSDLLSLKFGNLEFSDFAVNDFAIVINNLTDDFTFADMSSSDLYQSVNNMPALFDEFATIAHAKQASLSIRGEYENDVPSYSKSLSSLRFAGSAVFNANEGEDNAKIALTMNQDYANASNKNVLHDLRFEMNKETSSTDASIEDQKTSVRFAYQSKDVKEVESGTEKGGLYGKGYASSLTDLWDYMRALFTDEKTMLRERIVNPVRNLTTLINLSKTQNTNTEEASSSGSSGGYFSFLKTSYIKGITSVTESGFETLTLTLNGQAFDLDSDINLALVRYASNHGNHLAGELKSIDLSLRIDEKKTLGLSLGIEPIKEGKYQEVSSKIDGCPMERTNANGIKEAINYYDFSSLATLAKFGIDTGLKQNSYYWIGNVAVGLGELNGLIDVKAEIYIKVSGSSFKMMGKFNVPLIPDVNGPTDNVTPGLRELAGFGERTVSFYYDANTNYKENTSNSRLYFKGHSDVKGSVFDTDDYASFDMSYVLNHTEDVFLGYVLDLYPSLLKKDAAQEDASSTAFHGNGAPTSIEGAKEGDTYSDLDTGYSYVMNQDGEWVKNSSTDITLDNEYDSIISDYESDGKNWSVALDAAALLGIMNITTDSFVFDMNARHVANMILSISTNGNVLTEVNAGIRVYLGINAKIDIHLENVNPTLNDAKTRYENKTALKQFEDALDEEGSIVEHSAFNSYLEAHKEDVLNTVYSRKGSQTSYSEDCSWVLHS